MKFVFCEGKNDVKVTESLAKHLRLDIKVEFTGGKDNITNFLRDVSKRPEFARQEVASFGIIRDADANSESAFTSVCAALQQNKFTTPATEGTFSNGMPRVGVRIVGVAGRGMIEDVCLQSVSDRPEFSCVESYFNCIADKSERKTFSSKAKVRVWMASHSDYELHVGAAAEEGYWPWDNAAFDPLKDFLRAL